MQEEKRNLYEYHDRLQNEQEARFESLPHLQTVFARLSLQAILEDTKDLSERNFKILSSKNDAD